MTILITFLALNIVIFLHELGHMMMARQSGIGVLEFSVGMGPVVYGKKKGGTFYSFRLFPLGGFVKLAGFDDEEGHSSPPECNYYNKSLWARFKTISAGSVVNILSGFIVFFLIYAIVGAPRATSLIEKVIPDSPAFKAGLQTGDRLLEVNGKPVQNVEKDAIQVIHRSFGTSLSFLIERNGAPMSLSVTPDGKKSRALIGIQLESKLERFNPLRSLQLGLSETMFHVKMVFISLKLLIFGKISVKEMAGPIGIVQFASFELQRSVFHFLKIIAIISVSLGVINLFPFPILDGGHIMLLTLEGLRKKPLSKKWVVAINNIGAVCLITLMVLVLFNDIKHWSERTTFLKNSRKF